MENNHKKLLLLKLREYRLDEDLTYSQLSYLIKTMTGNGISISQLKTLCQENIEIDPHERTLHRLEKFLKRMGVLN